MTFYDRWVLPWLIDLSMRNKEARRYRERVIPQATGRLLEVGIGSGLNLPFYGAGVRHLFALEPSPELRRMACCCSSSTGLPPTPVCERGRHRLNPLWNRVRGGCNLNRKIDEMIVQSAFRLAELEMGYAKGFKPLSFMYSGCAVPA